MSTVSELQECWNAYEESVQNIADVVFRKRVLPVLKRRGWRLQISQSDWRIGPVVSPRYEAAWPYMVYPARTPKGLESDEEWQQLLELLETEIPGMRNIDLGCLMQDYKPGETK